MRQRCDGESQPLAAAYLSGAFAEVGAQPSLGITVDQIAAQKIGQDTPLPSLELTIEEPSLNCGDGLSCSYATRSPGRAAPLPMQNNPQVVFERLFGDGNTAEQRKERRAQSISLLDSVVGEASSLQRKLPASDRTRLDQYLSDVREIERRVQKAGQQLSDDLPVPEAPTGVPRDVEEHIKLMRPAGAGMAGGDHARLDVPHVQRIERRHLSKERRARCLPYALASLQRQEGIERFAVLNTYHVGLFACFLEKLRATPDGDGTLLDHSLVLYGSGMSDGNQHNHTDLPIVLAGGASGRLKGGRHLRHPKNTPMANLLVAMLDTLEIPTDRTATVTAK